LTLKLVRGLANDLRKNCLAKYATYDIGRDDNEKIQGNFYFCLFVFVC